MAISDRRADLICWSDRTRLIQWVPVHPLKPTHIVFTYASTQCWGASCEGHTISGLRSTTQRRQHINVLEMQTILSILKLWSVAWHGQLSSSALTISLVCFTLTIKVARAFLISCESRRPSFVLQKLYSSRSVRPMSRENLMCSQICCHAVTPSSATSGSSHR